MLGAVIMSDGRYTSEVFAMQYEYTKGQKSNNGDIDYYSSKLKHLSGRTLEVGAGTGRITLELLKQGLDVVGIDNAKAMIDLAIKKSRQAGLQAEFSVLDVVDINPNDCYDNIIIPFNSLCFFPNAQLEFIFKKFQKIFSRKSGNLIFDFTRPEANQYREVKADETSWSIPLFLSELGLYITWLVEVLPQIGHNQVVYRYHWKVSRDQVEWDKSTTEMIFSSLSFEHYHSLALRHGFREVEVKVLPYNRYGESEDHYFCHYCCGISNK